MLLKDIYIVALIPVNLIHWLGVVLFTSVLIVFAFLAIGYQTYWAAVLNPSLTLKYEQIF